MNDNALMIGRALALAAAISRHERVRLLLQAPTLTSEQVAESFIDVCNDELNDKGKRLVRLLSENKRIILLAEIARIYENSELSKKITRCGCTFTLMRSAVQCRINWPPL